MIDLEKALN